MPGYTDYTQDSTYWTIRSGATGTWSHADSPERTRRLKRWGWYRRAGAAATAVGVLSYLKGLREGESMMRRNGQDLWIGFPL